MKTEQRADGTCTVYLDEEYAERLESIDQKDALSVIRAGWRRSSAPHNSILVDWGHKGELLAITFGGLLAERFDESQSITDVLRYALSQEVLKNSAEIDDDATDDDQVDVAEIYTLMEKCVSTIRALDARQRLIGEMARVLWDARLVTKPTVSWSKERDSPSWQDLLPLDKIPLYEQASRLMEGMEDSISPGLVHGAYEGLIKFIKQGRSA